MASMHQINKGFRAYRDLYFTLLARGAAREYPTEMQYVRSKINATEDAWLKLMSSPGRLYDVVTQTGKDVLPVLKKIERKYPAGTFVEPGSTGEEKFAPESSLPRQSTEELLEQSPVNIGEKEGEQVTASFATGSWYAPGGVDLRIVGGVALGFVALSYFMRRR